MGTSGIALTSTFRSANIGSRPSGPFALADPLPSTPKRVASVPLEPRAVDIFSRETSSFVNAYRAGRRVAKSVIFTVYPSSASFPSAIFQGACGGTAAAPGPAGGSAISFARSGLPSLSRTTARAPPALATSPTTSSRPARSTFVPASLSEGAWKNGCLSPRFVKRGDFSSAERLVSVVLPAAPAEYRYFVLKSRTPSFTSNFTRSS